MNQVENKEELSYIVEDKVLAEILGRQNFSNKESAILELVKNAYDAGSKNLSIIFRNTDQGVVLNITDDGDGMDEMDIKNAWMHVGKSTRGYSNNETKRVYAGSKGIGRFALSRLGENVEMKTRKENSTGIVWNTDWEKSFLKKSEQNLSKGTVFVISKLRDRWTRRAVKPLSKYLSKIYNDTKMRITIEFENEKEVVEKIWSNPTKGDNYVTSLNINYDEKNYMLKCTIESDEFNDLANEISRVDSIKLRIKELNMFDQLSKVIRDYIEDEKKDDADMSEDEKKDISDNEIKQVLTDIGSFSGQFYFSLKSMNQDDYEWFEYKYKNLLNRYQTGIILYRNAFGIDSFEGRNDWLGLSKRASSSPAAASHPTGNWRVRVNQISGYIEIDKKTNKLIEDLSNRQGIVENIYYEVFRQIIIKGFGELESFRQEIIRDINKFKKRISNEEAIETEDTVDAVKIINNLRTNFVDVKSLTEDEVGKIITEFDRRETNTKNIEREKKEIEEKSRYEVQLLNVLATSQLKVNSLGHEIKNDRNNIASTPEDLEEAIKKITEWETLNNKEVPLYRNIPRLLENLKKNNSKILHLTDTILEEMEKEKFDKLEYDLNEVLEQITDKWVEQYSWVKFKINIDSSKKVLISYDQLMVIFDNLILNSIQKNEDSSFLEISIELLSDENMIFIEYRDNGKGLDKKYLSNPRKILEVHESTREKGHGLGMWMVNNTIDKLNGEIEKINGYKGFYLSAFIKV